MEKVAIIYGSSTGNTEAVAVKMAQKIGENITETFNVSEFSTSRLDECKNLIFGISTWGIGDLQEDWNNFLPEFRKADLKGKIIALFGLGDYESYPDSFVDGMGAIYELIKDKGCTLIGQVDTSDYTFDKSKAVYKGRFVGLPLDEDNESDLTDTRIENWLNEILKQFL